MMKALENEIYNEIQARIDTWERELKTLEDAAVRAAALRERIDAAKSMQVTLFPVIVQERAALVKVHKDIDKA